MNKHIERFSAAQQKLLSHHWPGNVRELRKRDRAGGDSGNGAGNPARNLPDFHLETRLRKGDVPMVTAGQSLDEIYGDV